VARTNLRVSLPRKVVLYFLEIFAQRFGHDESHVDGHQQRHNAESREHVRHGKGGEYVRERLEDCEHEQVTVGHQQATADSPDGRGQQFADQRPREHEHAQRAVEHEQHNAAQGQRELRRPFSRRAERARHQHGRQGHTGAGEHQQRFPADVERQQARDQARDEPDAAQHGQRFDFAHRTAVGGHDRLEDGQRVRYGRVGARQLLQEQQQDQYGHRPIRRGTRPDRRDKRRR